MAEGAERRLVEHVGSRWRLQELAPPERKWLGAIIHEGDAEAVVKEKKEKALAEHVADHPEDAGRTVEDFKWIMHRIVKWRREAGDPPLDDAMKRRKGRLHVQR